MDDSGARLIVRWLPEHTAESLDAALRELGAAKPLVMWAHHADDQPSMEGLEFTRERKAWMSPTMRILTRRRGRR